LVDFFHFKGEEGEDGFNGIPGSDGIPVGLSCNGDDDYVD